MHIRCIVVEGLAPTRPYKVYTLLVFADGVFNIANELDDLSDIEKLKIYSEIEQLAMDAIQDAKQMGALH